MSKIKIVNASTEDKRELYKMTKGTNARSFKDALDEIVEVNGFVSFIDEKDNGDEVEMLSIISKDGVVYCGQSKTLRDEFFNIKELMENEEFSIKIYGGKTKAGRDFLSCELI